MYGIGCIDGICCMYGIGCIDGIGWQPYTRGLVGGGENREVVIGWAGGEGIGFGKGLAGGGVGVSFFGGVGVGVGIGLCGGE
jgi:hypothetical protein